MDCSLAGSSVHGILQVRILEWAAISFSRGSSHPRDWTQVSCIAGKFFANWAMREAPVLKWSFSGDWGGQREEKVGSIMVPSLWVSYGDFSLSSFCLKCQELECTVGGNSKENSGFHVGSWDPWLSSKPLEVALASTQPLIGCDLEVPLNAGEPVSGDVDSVLCGSTFDSLVPWLASQVNE